MPFTFSHLAIVLPLKKWFSLTGLIIGSMVPDFEYFVRMRIKSDYSHTIEGIFWFDLPLGILLAFIFHNIVKTGLFDNLPYCLKARFCRCKQFNWNEYFIRNWIIVIISILIGTASHLFWDGFTHSDGYFVQIIPALSQAIEIIGLQIPVLKLLQHGSTIIGALVIIYTIYRIPIEKNTEKDVNVMYWVFFIIIALSIVIIRLLSGLSYRQYGNLIVSVISAGLISLMLTPYFIRKRKK